MNYYMLHSSSYVKGKTRHASFTHIIPKGERMWANNSYYLNNRPFPEDVFFPIFKQEKGSLADVMFPITFSSSRLFICNENFYNFLTTFDLDEFNTYHTILEEKKTGEMLDIRIIHFWKDATEFHQIWEESFFYLAKDIAKEPIQFNTLSEKYAVSANRGFVPLLLRFERLFDVFFSQILGLCCTQTFKDAYEASGLTGLAFSPILCPIEFGN